MTLSSLPNELLLHLIDFLDWPSLKHLRLTSPTFSQVLPAHSLEQLHRIRAARLHHEELLLLEEVTKFYWEEAEESFLGYHSSSYSSASLDPDIRAHEESLHCIHHKLACYRCLTWKASLTDSPAFENLSAFSRQMSTGARNLGSKLAGTRVCIECGVRTGMYGRGAIVKHSVVCYGCRRLTGPFQVGRNVRGLRDEEWIRKWLCGECCVSSRYAGFSRRQFEHELRWERYEASMEAGKVNRVNRGREMRLRLQSGGLGDAVATESEGSMFTSGYKKPRYCPVMKEMRLCHCVED